MDRPPVVARVEAEDVPPCCVFDADNASESWTLTEPVMRSVNGFNSRCLHIITGQDYRVTATAPEYDLLLAIHQHRLRYLGHILRMPESRVVRRALVAHAKAAPSTLWAASLWTVRQ